MKVLEKVSCYSKNIDNMLNLILPIADWQLDFGTVDSYKRHTGNVIDSIFEYKSPPSSFRCIESNDIFEDTVRCLSKIEDMIGKEIDHIVIPFRYTTDRINLCEFYGDCKEVSLEVTDSSEVIKAIAFIEHNRYNHVNLCLANRDYEDKWYRYELYHAIKSYIGAIDFSGAFKQYKEDIQDRLTSYNFNGYFVK